MRHVPEIMLKFRRFRFRTGLTQAEAAMILKTTRSYICRLEKGTNRLTEKMELRIRMMMKTLKDKDPGELLDDE